jgi:hypothetical protein
MIASDHLNLNECQKSPIFSQSANSSGFVEIIREMSNRPLLSKISANYDLFDMEYCFVNKCSVVFFYLWPPDHFLHQLP